MQVKENERLEQEVAWGEEVKEDGSMIRRGAVQRNIYPFNLCWLVSACPSHYP